MNKGNVIDLNAYREKRKMEKSSSHPISDELKVAIQMLIERLRELGPSKNSKLV